MSATSQDGLSSFLLEMAFDRAGVKARLAAALRAERAKRGGGDERRFPQPQMATELGYSLRQYQRLEDPDDANLPTWKNIESIAEKLGLSAADIFDDGEPEATPSDGGETLEALEAMRKQVQAVLAEVRAMRREVDARLAALEELRQVEAAAARSRRA